MSSKNSLETPVETDDERTMPLTSSEFAPDAASPLSGGEKKRRISSGTVLLILVVVLAGGGLFSMRKLAVASANGPVMGDIEKLIGEVLSGNSEQSVDVDRPLVMNEELLKSLNVDYVAQQIPITNVQKNPFVIYSVAPPPVDHPTLPVSTDREAELQQRRTQFRNDVAIAASVFKLKSVMGGGSPDGLANINGQIVRIGHTITDTDSNLLFKVWAIDKDSVTLVVENTELSVSAEAVVKVHPDS